MFPKKIKQVNLYVDAVSHLGEIAELTLPNLAISTEDWRGGGYLGPIKIDTGLEAIEFEWTLGGYSSIVTKQFGNGLIDGTMLRALGAAQSDNDGAVTAVEVLMRGRHTQLDRGNWKPGSDTEFKIKSSLSYYREIADGEPLIEINLPGGVFIVGGVDRYAAIRAAIAA